ncbi:ABC transporter permease [Acidisoma cellulosilytica]|uniref:ABC transporter permease n=1 Tax=Acidisoma cellulosilyticum TaxID=2802395 RepID=A0A964E5R7_9PROT|nr:ABC transporter permease [Acidisoma cellulosilyticum]MCB8882258.1 ABC transporter permease [Acidisoma cellulosilyticum]
MSSQDIVEKRGTAAPQPKQRQVLVNFAANYGLAVIFVLVLIVFGLMRPDTYLSRSNIGNLLTSQSVTALLALAVMMPLTTGRFDLSVGYHVGLAQVLMVGLQANQQLPWVVSAIIVLAVGAAVGAINGFLVTRFKIDSFIATMGVGSLLYGLSNWYTQGMQISGLQLPAGYLSVAGDIFGIPFPAIIVLLVGIILWIVLERIPAGRSLYFIGFNPRAAELSGINVGRAVNAAFISSGLLCALAGIMLGAILRSGTPSVGPEYLLPAFAASLLGATSIRPGRVNVGGTLLSILILAFSFSGVQQLGAAFYVEYLFNGGILVVAVALSVYAAARRRKSAVHSSAH